MRLRSLVAILKETIAPATQFYNLFGRKIEYLSLQIEETILSEAYTEAELFSNPGFVANSRATALQQALPPASQGRVTMAVAVVEDAQENRRVVIGTSEPNGYLRPGIKSALQPEESVIQGLGHAEADLVD